MVHRFDPRGLVLACAFLTSVVACDSQGAGREGPGVSLASPAGDLFARGVVAIDVVVSGGSAEEVVLLLDDDGIADLQPPYEHAWDTSVVPEGTYALRAKATIGGREFVSDPRSVTVDRTPPTITSRSPAPARSRVSVREAIDVTFSEPIQADSVDGSSVVVLDGAGNTLSASATASAGGDRLTVGLDGVPSVPNTLTVVLTEGITDRAGNALVLPPDAWRFDLPAWLALGDAFSASGTASAPALAVDPAGRPVSGWIDGPSGERQRHVRRWAGDAWERVGQPRDHGSGYLFLEVAWSVDDRPVVAYSDGLGFRVDRWTGAAWDTFGDAQSELGSVLDVALAVDGRGHPMVVSREYFGTYDRLYAKRWDGDAWQLLPRPIPGTTTYSHSESPALALDVDGSPVVAWNETSPLDRVGVHVQAWSGDAWQVVGDAPIAEVTTSAAADRPPALALDSLDRPIVAWSEADGTSLGIDVRRWTGDTWQPLGRALSAHPGDTPATRPSLVLDIEDRPIVAWQESNGTTEDVHVARWSEGAWETIGVLSAHEGATPASMPALAIGDGGELVAAWREDEGSRHGVHVWTYNQ